MKKRYVVEIKFGDSRWVVKGRYQTKESAQIGKKRWKRKLRYSYAILRFRKLR